MGDLNPVTDMDGFGGPYPGAFTDKTIFTDFNPAAMGKNKQFSSDYRVLTNANRFFFPQGIDDRGFCEKEYAWIQQGDIRKQFPAVEFYDAIMQSSNSCKQVEIDFQ
ncbi:MAG: hypothetical protein ACOZF0_20710 [Thermodesulfobacteriota bacterium]